MTIIRIRQNQFGGWLVIIGGILAASFLTHRKAIAFAREVLR
jgi:hypothetical protein